MHTKHQQPHLKSACARQPRIGSWFAREISHTIMAAAAASPATKQTRVLLSDISLESPILRDHETKHVVPSPTQEVVIWTSAASYESQQTGVRMTTLARWWSCDVLLPMHQRLAPPFIGDHLGIR